MQRRLFIAAGLAFGALGSALAAAPTLSATQVAERNAAARGGLAAWQAVRAVSMSGQLDAGGKDDVKLPFSMTLQRPRSSRLEISFHDQTALQVYDGSKGWKVRPFLNRNEVEPYTAVEAKIAAGADELDGPLIDYARKGTKVELAGTESVEGKDTYKLQLTAKDGTRRLLWVDAATFLETRIEGEPRKLNGKMHKVSIYYRDYKTVAGLMIPHTVETVVEGVPQTRKMSIQKVSVNPKLDAALFAKPQLQALAARMAPQ